MRTNFLRLWASQLLTLTGTALTSFGLGVWIFNLSGSATQFALVMFSATVPGVLVGMFAGSVVDRYNRRLVLLSAVGVTLAGTTGIAYLYWAGDMRLIYIYFLNAIASLCAAFQRPAYLALVSRLIDKDQLGRANGLTQLAIAGSQLIAPPLAGFLIGTIGLGAVLVLDVSLGLVGFALLIAVRVPESARKVAIEAKSESYLLRMTAGFSFIKSNPGLSMLLAYYTFAHFMIGMLVVLITPLILSLYSPVVLGMLLSFGGLGMLAGSLTMFVWGGPRRLMQTIFVCYLIVGVFVVAIGLNQNLVLMYLLSFGVLFFVPLIEGCDQTVWQSATPLRLQGRVLSLRHMLTGALLPPAAITAGLLVDNFFGPAMLPGGVLAASLQAWLGVGAGRGIGVLFVCIGALTVASATFMLVNPGIRLVSAQIQFSQS